LTAGKSAAVKLGVRLGRPVAAIYGALEAGNLFAWLGIAVLVIGIGLVAYYERKELARAGRWILAKVKSRL